MADYIIKTPKLITVIGRFNSLGMGKVRNPYVKDDLGNDYIPAGVQIENTLGDVMTPPQTMPDGAFVFRVRLSDKDANKLPHTDTPNFSVLWDSVTGGAEPSWVETIDGVTRPVYVGRISGS